MSRVLLFFIDGVGIGPDEPDRNPFAAAPPPVISQWLADGVATTAPLDATLDVAGLPQSGTGQYSLFTGDNGARRFGRHHGPWVPTALRDELRHDNLLTRARAAGWRVTCANAYPEQLITSAYRGGEFRPVGPLRAGVPLAAFGAGVLSRHADALLDGDAVASEIVNDGWRDRLLPELERVTAAEAGRRLARIANRHDLTLFAHYQTDTAGHTQDMHAAIAALHRVDEFLGGVVGHLHSDITLVIVSDHGNLEDVSAGHTRNPALGLVAGPHHRDVGGRLRSLLDVPDRMMALLAQNPNE